MKTKPTAYLLLLFLIFVEIDLWGNAPENLEIPTDLVIGIEKEQYVVISQFSREVFGKFKEATEAIQYAVDYSGKGDHQVLLRSGLYVIDKSLKMKSRVSLKGSGTGTILWMAENHDSGTAIEGVDLDRVSISSLSIKSSEKNPNARVGIMLSNCGDSKVEDIFCMDLREYGIWLRNNSFLCEIRNCRIAGVDGSGILLDDLKMGRGGDFVPNLVSNCMVYGGGIGIEIRDGAIVANIVGCQIYQTSKAGIYLHQQANSVSISSCRTFQVEGHAVHVKDSDEINISSNIFCWHTGHGVYLERVHWGTVTGNNIIDSGSINFEKDASSGPNPHREQFLKTPPPELKISLMNGVYLKDKTMGITVSGNAVFSWGVVPPMKYGIYEDESCRNNLMTSNNVNYVAEDCVSSNGQGSIAALNICEAEESYRFSGLNKFQTFDFEKIRAFIESQR